MSDLIGASLPWWAWAFMAIGVIALVSVIGALFLPDWKPPDYAHRHRRRARHGGVRGRRRLGAGLSGLSRRRGHPAAERRRVLSAAC